jgi:hypothetical protein
MCRKILQIAKLVSIAAVAVTASCQQTAYYGQDITPDQYPDNSAVVLERSRIHECEFRLELVRTFVWDVVWYVNIEECTRVKILTESGLDNYGDMVSDLLHKEYSKYEVEARVISPDGKVSDVDPKNVTRLDVGKNYEQYRIAFPGLKVGSVIEIREKVHSQHGDMAGRWDFASDVPTLKSKLVFKVPSGSKVRFAYMPPREEETEIVPTQEGRYDVYSFTIENVPPYRSEPLMSVDHAGNPTLRYYTWMISNETLDKVLGLEEGSFRGQPFIMTWNNIAKIYSFYFEPLGWEEDKESKKYRAERDAFIDTFKSRGFADNESMLRAFVMSFREGFQAIEQDHLFQYKNPEECYLTREGSAFELAYIMCEMLTSLGFAPSVILVRDLNEGRLDKKMPTLYAFTDAILHIEYAGKTYWLDPGSHTCRLNQVPWRCRGEEGLWLKPGGDFVFKRIPLNASEANGFANVEDVELDGNGDLRGTARITITGQDLITLRKHIDEEKGGETEDALDSLLRERFPMVFSEEGLSIVKESDDSLVVTYTYHKPGFADVSGDFMNVDFSDWIWSSYLGVFKSDDRRYDMHFPFLRKDLVCVRMKIPEGMQAVELPQNVEQESGCFAYTRRIAIEGNVIIFRRCMSLETSTIGIGDYEEMKRFMSDTYKLDRETLVLQRM